MSVLPHDMSTCVELVPPGAVFETQMHCVSLKLFSDAPKVTSEGILKMDPESYFYDKNTSLLINHCAFVVDTPQGEQICVLKIRNSEGLFFDRVKLKDFGSTISSDFHNAAYNFDGMVPELLIPINSTWQA